MHRRPHLRAALSGALLCTLTLGGCSGGSGAPTAEPAPSASSGACASALSQLPASVLGHPRMTLDVAGAAAWGPPAVVLRCGLPALRPTGLTCMSVDDVDWVFDDGGQDVLFTTFGRAPALEVRVPHRIGLQNASAALVDVKAVAAALPRNGRHCDG